MPLIRWEPFREVEALQREMNRLFDTLSNGESPSTFFPAAEIHETPDAIQLCLEVPGLEAKDIDIEVSAEAVAISGERKGETTTEEKGFSLTEFRYGSFRRVIPLPTRVENTSVTAEYKDGILRLNLPKAEEEKNKVVKVSIG